MIRNDAASPRRTLAGGMCLPRFAALSLACAWLLLLGCQLSQPIDVRTRVIVEPQPVKDVSPIVEMPTGSQRICGQRVAIVGPTGAGKTTIVNLLLRFYDVDSGAIRIDGPDIRSLTRRDLRKLFGMVLQDSWLYNASIMENIRYGKLDATDE